MGACAPPTEFWRNGGLLVHLPSESRWVAIFLAFPSQAWHTDGITSHPVVTAPPCPGRQAGRQEKPPSGHGRTGQRQQVVGGLGHRHLGGVDLDDQVEPVVKWTVEMTVNLSPLLRTMCSTGRR